MKAFHLVLFVLLLIGNAARKFELCELYYKLRALGMDGFRGIEVKKLVCLSQFPAEGNTRHYAVDHRNIPYYGIFQLSGHEWCDNGRHTTQNKCNTSCNNFLDDNIRDDVQCLKKVLTEYRINHWRHYKNNCNLNTLRIYNLKCAFFFENDKWYKNLVRDEPRKPLKIHIHFPST
ncbi:lysozyme C-like isoform X1 [Anolis sagrei]|uniref:lysozyme C-like isoform X1 n=2 Tax=Anolis sagrei TaxID=38937 RepID=UPI0035210FC9